MFHVVAEFENAESALSVEGDGFLEALVEPDGRRRVEDDVDLLAELLPVDVAQAQVRQGHVALDHFDLFEVLRILLLQLVEDGTFAELLQSLVDLQPPLGPHQQIDGVYAVAAPQQLLQQSLAHESRSAGDEHLRVPVEFPDVVRQHVVEIVVVAYRLGVADLVDVYYFRRRRHYHRDRPRLTRFDLVGAHFTF